MPKQPMCKQPIHAQQGFTLIELMISLVLGLLIMAAAFQLFYTGLLSNNIQQAGSQIVSNTTFGADSLARHLQRANLGSLGDNESNDEDFLNHLTALGGVVLTAPNNKNIFGTKLPPPTNANHSGLIVGNNLRGLNHGGNLIPTTWLSRDGGQNASDQLTIQYQMRESNQTDCMGRLIKANDYVIERYFVKNGDLRCASAIYTYDKAAAANKNGVDISVYNNPNGQTGSNNLGSDGQVVIANVDSFQILMGITDSKNFLLKPDNMAIRYIPIPNPNQLNSTFGLNVATGKTTHRIVSLQMGILLRGDNRVKAPQTTYQVLNATIQAPNDGRTRSVYSGSILIRNARGVVA